MLLSLGGVAPMPIYEYRCGECGKVLEVIQKFSDDPLETCPECRGRLTKLISKTSFQLKGTGWYVTDYARKPESKPKTESTDSKTESKIGEKKTDASPKSQKTPSSQKQ